MRKLGGVQSTQSNRVLRTITTSVARDAPMASHHLASVVRIIATRGLLEMKARFMQIIALSESKLLQMEAPFAVAIGAVMRMTIVN